MSPLILAWSFIPAVTAGQTSAPSAVTTWARDYRAGLRLELVEGELDEAIPYYRRVAVSHAPEFYVQRAQYRLANVLTQLGRDDEARALLHGLRHELPRQEPLLSDVNRLLDAAPGDAESRGAYWTAQLQEALKGRDLHRLREAGAFFAHQEGDAGVEVLLEVYRGAPRPTGVRAALLELLAETESPRVVQAIREGLTAEDPAVAAAAVRAVARMGDAKAEPQLVELLASRDAAVRLAAVVALRDLRSLQAVERLAELLGAEKDAEIRRAVIEVLHCLGSPAAMAAIDKYGPNEAPGDCACHFSRWYREVVDEKLGAQKHFLRRSSGEASPPRVGVVVSAMTHHGPRCGGLIQPYARQIRKAWSLQRAGFEVCLLAEPEVLLDVEASDLPRMLEPSVTIHPVGDWPDCDVVVLDQLFRLPQPVIDTLEAYTSQGGNLIICGAVGGGQTGDKVALRELLGVRRPHVHRFRSDGCRLVPTASDTPGAFDAVLPHEWVGPRSGTGFAHDTLGGDVLAAFDAPDIWAVKTHAFGSGRVLSFNWDIGLNVAGTHDEDELLARFVDGLVHDDSGAGPPRHRLMRHLRWGRLAEARAVCDADALAPLSATEQIETLLQLSRIYLMENNRPAGEAAVGRLERSCDASVPQQRPLEAAAA